MDGTPNVPPLHTSLLLNAASPQEDVVTGVGFPSFSLPSFRRLHAGELQSPSLLAGARNVYSSANFPDVKLKPGVFNTPPDSLSHLPVARAILEATRRLPAPPSISSAPRASSSSAPSTSSLVSTLGEIPSMPLPRTVQQAQKPLSSSHSRAADRRPARSRKKKVHPDYAYNGEDAESHTPTSSSSSSSSRLVDPNSHRGVKPADVNSTQNEPLKTQKRAEAGGDDVMIVDKPKKKRKISHEPREPIVDPVERYLASFRAYLTTFLQNISKLSADSAPYADLWKQVGNQVAQLSTWKVLHKAPSTELSALLQSAVSVIKDAGALQILTPFTLPDKSVLSRTLRGLDVAILALRIMASPQISRECISDDVVEPIVTLLTHHVNRTVLAEHDASLRSSAPTKKGKRKKGDDQFESNYWLVIRPKISEISTKIIAGFDLLQQYIRTQSIQDQQVYPLLHACFQSFHVEKVRHLQMSALRVVTAIFLHCEEHRVEIRKSLIRTMLKGTGRRSYAVDLGSSRTNIHIDTALLLHLLQSVSSVSLEPSQAHKLKSINEDASRSRRAEIFKRTLTEPHSIATRCAEEFVRAFLASAFGRSEKDVHKEVFTEFVADLVPLLFQPEWPAVELVLKQLVQIMHAYIISKKSEKGFVAARSLCLETVGTIAVAVKTHLKQCEENPIVVSQKKEEVNMSALPGTEGEDARCICNRGASNEFMLDCDDCHRWFHGKCVGIHPNKIPKVFICEDCHIRREVERQRSRADTKVFKSQADRVGDLDKKGSQLNGDEDDEDDDGDKKRKKKDGDVDADEVLRTLLINFLAKRLHAGSTIIQFARQFHIADMLSPGDADGEQEVSDSDLSFFRRHWVPQVEEAVDPESVPTLSRDTIVRVNRQLGKDRPLLRMFDSLLNVILYFLSEKQPTLRSRAMRSLRALVTADSSVLQAKRVCRVVTQRSQDKSPSVRETTVDLIGKYVLECPDAPKLYVTMLRARIMDSGLAVRKRAIKTLRALCINNASHADYVDICVQLVQRVNDSEESIHQLILDTVEQLWFTEDNDAIAKRIDTDAGADLDTVDVSTMSRRDVLKKKFTKDFVKLASKLVAVVNKIPNTRWLVNLIARMLSREEKKGKGFACRKVHRICEDFCMCIVMLIERLDSDDEDSDDENKDDNVSSQFALFAQIEPYVKTLEMFCTARPMFLVDHIYALQPYLKATPTTTEEMVVEGAILQHVLSVFLMCFPLAEDLQPSFTKHVEEDLRAIITKKGAAVLRVAVPCLSILAQKLMQDTTVLHQMLYQYVHSLTQYIDKPQSLNAREVQLFVMRSLLALGLLMKHFDFEASDEPLNGFTGRKTDIVFDIYSRCWELNSVMLKQYAVQGVFFLFGRRPELLLQAQSILADAFDRDAEPRLSLTTLNSIREFLESEQARDEFLRNKRGDGTSDGNDSGDDSDDERAKVSGVHSMSTNLRKDDKTDAGILGGVIQQHLPSILSLMFSLDASIRDAALRLIRMILSHGFINPAWAVPHMIGLLVDESSSVAERALAELTSMDNKHHSILRSRITQGILQSYRFLNILLDNNFDPIADSEVFAARTERFDRFYTLFRTKATTRDPFIKLLCSLLDIPLCRKQAGADGIVLFLYVVQLAARLPYCFEAPFRIIRKTQAIIANNGSLIESKLSTIRSQLKKRGGGVSAEQRGKVMIAYRLACEEGLMISALSMLCSYLKATYQISDEKCENWTSSMRERVIRARDTKPIDLKRLPYIRHRDELTRDALMKAKSIPPLLKKQHEFFLDQLDDISTTVDLSRTVAEDDMTDDEVEDDIDMTLPQPPAASAEAAHEDLDPGYSSSSHKENESPVGNGGGAPPPPPSSSSSSAGALTDANESRSHMNGGAGDRSPPSRPSSRAGKHRRTRGGSNPSSAASSRSNSVASAHDGDGDHEERATKKKKSLKKRAAARPRKGSKSGPSGGIQGPKNLRTKKARSRKPSVSSVAAMAMVDDVIIPPERKSKRKRNTVKRYTPEDDAGSDADNEDDGGDDADVEPSMIPIDSSSCDSDEAYED